jgi:lysozyme
MNYSYSPRGLALTKQFEGLRLCSYQDSGGVWTIGYGHTGGVRSGQVISQNEADRLLGVDTALAAGCVNRLVTSSITQNQFDALVDFTFNLGCHRLAGSTLLRLVNEGNFEQAALEFHKWDMASGHVLPGLVSRRKAEAELFATV